jgi:hypothetical protein
MADVFALAGVTGLMDATRGMITFGIGANGSAPGITT